VLRVLPDRVIIASEPTLAAAPLKAGDGIVFDAAGWRSPEEPEEGGRIYQITQLRGGQLELRFGNGAIDSMRIRAGDLIWRTHDPDLDKVARPFTQTIAPVHKRPVNLHVTAHAGKVLKTVWHLAEHPEVSVTVRSEERLPTAQNRALDAAYLCEQLGRLGNTPYELADMELDLEGRPFAPASLLNTLRRQAVEQLAELQGRPGDPVINDPLATLDTALTKIPHAANIAPTEGPQLHLLVRTPEQLEAALELRPASITLDYLELYGLRPAVERVRAAGIIARVASPRVLKPSEQRIIHFLLKLGCEIVVRSSGLLQAFQDEEHPSLIGDFSLNAANVLTADAFLKLGLTRITASYDLNAVQITELAQSIGGDNLEVVAYHHLPVFHTEHCVFCRFLSSGTSYKDCGHPCEKHRVALRDGNGREHPVMADVGCRNTVFGAEAQEASRHLEGWRRAGIRHIRLEFAHETAEDVERIGRAFQDYLAGSLAAHELTRRLQRLAPQGTTEGSLFVPDNYEMIPLMQ
jgi:putative protease